MFENESKRFMQTVLVHWSVVLSLFVGMLMGQISKIHHFGDAAGISFTKTTIYSNCCEAYLHCHIVVPTITIPTLYFMFIFIWCSHSYSSSSSFSSSPWCDFLARLHLQLGSYLFIASPATTGSMISHTSRWPPTSADASSSNRTISFHSIAMLQATWCLISRNTPPKRGRRKESYKRCSYVPPKRV